jgi:hypothetical protein
MNAVEDMKLKLALLHDHMNELALAGALLVIHPDLPATIRVNHKNCADPDALCKSISLRWQVVRGATENTYECVEFPLKLVYEKPIMVKQAIPEEVIFAEAQ